MARRTRTSVGVAACLLVGTLHAQPERIDFSRIANLLQSLDTQAQSCLQSLDRETASLADATADCQQFLGSLDGDTVADYLRQCRAARDQRDRIVTESREQELSEQQRDTTLQLLLDTEYYCGEMALRDRTEFVFPAFAALGSAARRNPGRQRVDGLTPDSRSGGTDLIPIQPRLQGETNQLWQQLQLELLRQQINRPGN